MQINSNSYVAKALLFVALAVILAITYGVYSPGLHGPFVFDDGPNITNNADIALQNLHGDSIWRAMLGGASGPLGRPISMLSFALNFYEAGSFSTFDFKLTNLIIHLVAGIGVFMLSTEILNSQKMQWASHENKSYPIYVSLAVTAAWLLHPLNLTAVLYVVQRMTSLSALFSFWGLFLFAKGRNRLIDGKPGIALILTSLLVFTPLSVFSKESGALTPLLMFAMEVTLFQFRTKTSGQRKLLQILFAVLVGLPAAVVVLFLATHPSWLPNSYVGRNFTLSERVLTEPRILWFYLSQIALPNFKALGLFHDDIANSHGLLSPITTLPAIVGILALPVIAWFARKKFPILSFGLLFFLAGHALESTIFPLEITFEHRNYLPMYGILFALIYYLLYPLANVKTLRLRQIALLAFLAILTFDTWARSTAWATAFDRANDEVEHHPDSARDNIEIGNHYASTISTDAAVNESYYLRAQSYYEKANAVDPDATTGYLAMIILASYKDKPIDPRWIADLKQRLQTVHLENDIGNKLLSLVTCQQKQICKLSKQDLRGLLTATLANPLSVGGKRALILSAMSLYLVDIESDYPAARDTMYQTIALAPKEMIFRLTLIQFLAALRHFDEAKVQLDAARKMDTLHAHSSELEALEKQIIEQEKTPIQ
jgi:hypothetical protein